MKTPYLIITLPAGEGPHLVCTRKGTLHDMKFPELIDDESLEWYLIKGCSLLNPHILQIYGPHKPTEETVAADMKKHAAL